MTTEQVLLLNNLMYLEDNSGRPVINIDGIGSRRLSDIISKIDSSQLQEGSYMTYEDYQNIINAVKQDETLMNMEIVTVHTDTAEGGGNGRSAIFVSKDAGEAAVVFKGTEGTEEWADNFNGGNMTDTPCQKNALNWYKEAYEEYGLENYDVTVSGHSKGGNKAKYVCIQDSTVDHCVSFDGQGFSDEFMDKYSDKIGENQYKIENHNVDHDYVNILLNDVGETTYYKGYDYGEGGFLENHCPNTFMKFNEDGSFTMTVNSDGQAPEMAVLDEFINSYIRSMPDNEQDGALNMVNTILDYAFSFDDNTSKTDIANIYLQMAADPKYADDLAYFVAYTLRYEQENPMFAGQIKNILDELGMGEFTKYVDVADAVLNIDFMGIDFNILLGWINAGINLIPNWVLNILSEWLEKKYGIVLTKEQLRNLLSLIGMVNYDMENIYINDNGKDICIESVHKNDSGIITSGNASFKVILPMMDGACTDMGNVSGILKQLSGEILNEVNNISFSSTQAYQIKNRLRAVENDVSLFANVAKKMSEALNNTSNAYERTENAIINAVSNHTGMFTIK